MFTNDIMCFQNKNWKKKRLPFYFILTCSHLKHVVFVENYTLSGTCKILEPYRREKVSVRKNARCSSTVSPLPPSPPTPLTSCPEESLGTIDHGVWPTLLREVKEVLFQIPPFVSRLLDVSLVCLCLQSSLEQVLIFCLERWVRTSNSET